jgi:hypothetical protein
MGSNDSSDALSVLEKRSEAFVMNASSTLDERRDTLAGGEAIRWTGGEV